MKFALVILHYYFPLSRCPGLFTGSHRYSEQGFLNPFSTLNTMLYRLCIFLLSLPSATSDTPEIPISSCSLRPRDQVLMSKGPTVILNRSVLCSICKNLQSLAKQLMMSFDVLVTIYPWREPHFLSFLSPTLFP